MASSLDLSTTLGHPLQGPAPHRTFPWALLMAKYTPVSPYFLGELNDGRSGYPMSDMSETRVYSIPYVFSMWMGKILKNTDGYSEVPYFQTIPYVQEWVSWDLWEWGMCVWYMSCYKHDFGSWNWPFPILKKGNGSATYCRRSLAFIYASPALETFSILGHLGLSENLGENQAKPDRKPPTSTCESSCSPWKLHNTSYHLWVDESPHSRTHHDTSRRVVDAKRQQCRNQPLQRCLHEG